MFRSLLLAVLFITAASSATPAADAPPWVLAAKAVHSHFSGRKGTFAQFGDSITITKAYWSPLQWERKNMEADTQKAYENVKAYMFKDCWDWKGGTMNTLVISPASLKSSATTRAARAGP